MKTVDLLHELQTADSALDADRDSLQRTEVELADRTELEAARAVRDERAAALRKVEADQRDRELEVETLRAQLDAAEKKLYGGRVADARELQNLHLDAGQIRAQIGTREDGLLEVFDAADQAGAALTEAEARLRQLAVARRDREAVLTGERDRLVGAIGTGETRASSLRGQLDASTLRTYDNLRKSRGGLAVAELRQRTCQGCRVGLPVGVEQRVRHGDALITCQSCGRILYAGA